MVVDDPTIAAVENQKPRAASRWGWLLRDELVWKSEVEFGNVHALSLAEPRRGQPLAARAKKMNAVHSSGFSGAQFVFTFGSTFSVLSAGFASVCPPSTNVEMGTPKAEPVAEPEDEQRSENREARRSETVCSMS
jgi:hypothetical protein